jgi:imidazolonepropionase-like amidohydrolase
MTKQRIVIFMHMSRTMVLLAALQATIILMGCKSGRSPENPRSVVFRNVTVIDAVNGLRTHQSVITEGSMIVGSGPEKGIRKPEGAKVIDCRGKYLIPGLWDAHMHLTNNNALLPAMFPLLTVNGITCIRDAAAELNLILPLIAEARKASDSAGMAPEIFFIGPHLDGKQLSWSSSVSAETPEIARLIIDSLIKAGVNQVKVYDLLPGEVCLEVLSYAHTRGLKVSCHVPLAMDVVEVSDAGMASMEHMYNLEMSCSADWDSLLQARRKMIAAGSGMSGRELREYIYHSQRMHSFKTQDPARRDYVLKILAKNNTWQVPTLVIVAEAENRLFAREDYRRTFRYLPEPVRTEWEKISISRASQPPNDEGMAHAYWAYDMIPRLVEAGIGIMAGTDMPLAQLMPGYSLHEELALLVRSGMTPLQALESATLRPAQFFGIENCHGSIAKGMKADMILLEANPLDDIRNTQKISAVMRNGFLHTRDELDEILAGLENR